MTVYEVTFIKQLRKRNTHHFHLPIFIFHPLFVFYQVPLNSIHAGKYLLNSYYSTVIILDSTLGTNEAIERRMKASLHLPPIL